MVNFKKSNILGIKFLVKSNLVNIFYILPNLACLLKNIKEKNF